VSRCRQRHRPVERQSASCVRIVISVLVLRARSACARARAMGRSVLWCGVVDWRWCSSRHSEGMAQVVVVQRSQSSPTPASKFWLGHAVARRPRTSILFRAALLQPAPQMIHAHADDGGLRTYRHSATLGVGCFQRSAASSLALHAHPVAQKSAEHGDMWLWTVQLLGVVVVAGRWSLVAGRWSLALAGVLLLVMDATDSRLARLKVLSLSWWMLKARRT
jgi:hypothetical protein